MLRKWGRLIVAVETVWSIGMMIYTWLAGAVPFIGLPAFHWPFYLNLAMVGVVVLVGLSVDMDRFKPAKNKLHDEKQFLTELYDQMVYARHAGPARRKERETAARLWAELGGRMEQLKIPLPTPTEDGNDYRLRTEWLAQIISCAETKNLKKARRIGCRRSKTAPASS